MNSTQMPHNVIRGAQQQIEMSGAAVMDAAGEDDQSEHPSARLQAAAHQEWSVELRKADERTQEVRQRCEDFKRQNAELEARINQQNDMIERRDTEILRLGQLYQGGQNNDKLAMQYNQEQNVQIVKKLNSQIDFLNKENHRIQTELDLYSSDKTAVTQIEMFRKEVDELSFENQTLRKDLKDLVVSLKNYQEKEFEQQRRERDLQLEKEGVQVQIGGY
jgi:predicted RNase H-like nuclease (RuvC/YqgF family)